MKTLTTFAALILFCSTLGAQTLETAPDQEPIVGTRTPNQVVTETKNFGEVVEKKSVVRVVDKELKTVCYIAHGASFDSGVGIYCMPLPNQ